MTAGWHSGAPVSEAAAVAPMSKSFLAATALRLRDEGTLDLNRLIADYAPGTLFLLDGREVPVSTPQLLKDIKTPRCN